MRASLGIVFALGLVFGAQLQKASAAYTDPTGRPRSNPAAGALERMSPLERYNAEIDLRLGGAVTAHMTELEGRIERLWNTGAHAAALELFEELSALAGPGRPTVAISWRTPVPASGPSRQGIDVRIGNRDSVLSVNLDVHRASGHLFAILHFEGDGNVHGISICMSTNGGYSWAERSAFMGPLEFRDVSATVLGDHCYVAYVLYDSEIWLHRYRVSDGLLDAFPNDSLQIRVRALSDDVTELEIVSTQDAPEGADINLYLAAIGSPSRWLYAYWSNDEGVTWMQTVTDVQYADRGLDLATNSQIQTVGEYILWASYIDYHDVLRVDAWDPSGWEWYKTLYMFDIDDTLSDQTGIGAYGDTVFCAFECRGGTSYLRFALTHNQGASWIEGLVDDSTKYCINPDVTARDGGGIATAYHKASFLFIDGWFRWHPEIYLLPLRESYTDNLPSSTRPSVEYLGGGTYGIIYLSSVGPVRGAYFDGLSPCCISERGNVDGMSGAGGPIDVADLTFLVAYLFLAGPASPCTEEGNVDGLVSAGGPIDVADLTYLVAYLFLGGPSPPACP